MTIEYSCNACLKPSLHYVSMDIVISGKSIKLMGYYCSEHLKDRLQHIINYLDKPHVVKSLNPMENKE